jgi:hypothetical protein
VDPLHGRHRELHKRIIVEAAALSFCVTLVAFLALGVLANIFGEGSGELVAVVFCFCGSGSGLV